MVIQEYTTDEVAAQPIGYWTGVAHRAVTDRIRSSLGEEQLTQPHWWTLNQVAGEPRAWNRARLAAKLLPYADAGADFGSVVDDLVARGWLTEDAVGVLVLSEVGEAGLRRARDRTAHAHGLTTDGVTREEYAATVNVLRRMVANLGGDGNLPS